MRGFDSAQPSKRGCSAQQTGVAQSAKWDCRAHYLGMPLQTSVKQSNRLCLSRRITGPCALCLSRP